MITKLERNSNFLLPPEKHDERYDKTTTKQSQLFPKESNFLVILQKATTQKSRTKLFPIIIIIIITTTTTTTIIIILHHLCSFILLFYYSIRSTIDIMDIFCLCVLNNRVRAKELVHYH